MTAKKYVVQHDPAWKDFIAYAAPKGAAEPVVIDHADLKTGDGQPLPPAVVKEMVRRKALVPVKDAAPAPAVEPEPTPEPKPAPKPKTPKGE